MGENVAQWIKIIGHTVVRSMESGRPEFTSPFHHLLRRWLGAGYLSNPHSWKSQCCTPGVLWLGMKLPCKMVTVGSDTGQVLAEWWDVRNTLQTQMLTEANTGMKPTGGQLFWANFRPLEIFHETTNILRRGHPLSLHENKYTDRINILPPRLQRQMQPVVW